MTATKDKPLLLLTIPYDTGWEATVDGISAQIYPVVEDTFCGLVLSPGEHEVELLGLLGVTGLLLFALAEYKNGVRKAKGTMVK